MHEKLVMFSNGYFQINFLVYYCLLLTVLFTDKHDTQSPTPRYMTTFTQPLQNVLTAANEGNAAELNTHASILNARTNRLVKLADTASNTVSDQNLAR